MLYINLDEKKKTSEEGICNYLANLNFTYLNDSHQYCTGSKCVTTDMIGQGIIKFDLFVDTNFGKRIKTNTCSQISALRVQPIHTASSDIFNRNFCEDIGSAPGFRKT